jgi:hypothetical protein
VHGILDDVSAAPSKTIASTRRRPTRWLRLVVATLAAIGISQGPAPGGASASPRTATADLTVARSEATPCGSGDRPFRPSSISITHVVGATKVLAMGRDSSGVPIPPPLTDTGKWQFGWDAAVLAGATQGVVRLTAHTYPAFAGTALGNALLGGLHKGGQIIVSGGGQTLCYHVVRRVSVDARRSVPDYYASKGPPLLGIVVCSGVRRGPGDWSRRTVWFAAPG